MSKKFLPWLLIYLPLIFVCTQFFRSNLSQWDMGGHFIASKNFADLIWPNFVGWNPNQFSGYPQGYFYPSLFHWAISALSKVFPIEFSFKLLVVVSTLTIPLSLFKLAKSLFPEDSSKAINFVLGGMILYFIPKGPVGGDLYSTFRIGLVNQNWAMNFFYLFLAQYWSEKNSRDKYKEVKTGFLLGLTLLSHAIVGLAGLILLFIPFDWKRILKVSSVAFFVSSAWAIPYILYREYASGSGIKFLAGFHQTVDSDIATPVNLGILLLLFFLGIRNHRNYKIQDRCVQAFLAFLVLAIAVELIYLIPSIDPAQVAAIHFYRFQQLILFFGLVPLFYQYTSMNGKFYRNTVYSLSLMLCFFTSYRCIGSIHSDYNLGFRFTHESRVLVYQGTDSFLSLSSPHQLSNRLQLEGVKTLNGLFAESSRLARYYLSTLHELFSKPMIWGVNPMPYSPRLAKNHLRILGVDGIVAQEKLFPTFKNSLPLKAQQEGLSSESFYRNEVKAESFSAYLFENSLVELLERIQPIQSNWNHAIYEWWMSEHIHDWPLNLGSSNNGTIDKTESVNSNISLKYYRPSSNEIHIKTNSSQLNWYLVKESYFPNWKATSLEGAPLPLFEAAPSLIVVQSRGNFKLKFELSLIEKVAQFATLFSMILSGLWILFKIKTRFWKILSLAVVLLNCGHAYALTPARKTINLMQFDQLVVGSYHICKLHQNKIYCWGLNHFGQFGNGNLKPRDTLTLVSNWPNSLKAGAAGLSFTCFYGPFSVYCSGKLGTFQSSKPQLLLETRSEIRNLVASHLGLCITFKDSNIKPKCFGRLERMNLEQVAFPESVESVSLGANQLCIIRTKALECLNLEDQFKFKKISFGIPDIRWKKIASGSGHSCAVGNTKQKSYFYCWGDSRFHQTGGLKNDFVAIPQLIPHPNSIDWIDVEAGDSHTCALDRLGMIYCFGDNSRFESSPLKRGWFEKAIIGPTLVPKLTRVNSLKLNGLNSCALLDTYYSCWGVTGNGI